MIKSHITFFAIFTILLLSSCDKELNRSLEMAGSNRSELEKVLDYFENDPDPLKYRAAKFLIENMRFHFYHRGNTIDKIDSIYQEAKSECLHNRTKSFENSFSKIDALDVQDAYDLRTIKASFLIKAIDDACDAWNRSTWHDDYDEMIFFEYVLPYRLVSEPLSDWHNKINEEFPLLSKNLILSRRGIQYEAENEECMNCKSKEYVGASNNKAVMLFADTSTVSFTINSEYSTQKRLILKYSSESHNLKAYVGVNGIVIETLHLSPSRNLATFDERWFNFSLPIRKGCNIITISAADTMCLDYIQLAALEKFEPKDVKDFSGYYYNLINAKSHSCVAYDTAFAVNNKIVRLMPYSIKDSTQLVRLDYSGYPLWRIGYYKRDSIDMCLQMEFGQPNTLMPNSPVTSGEYVMRPFNQWLFMPLGDDTYRIMNKHTGLFLDTSIDSIHNYEILVQKEYSESESQKWQLRKQGINPYSDNMFSMNSAVSETMRVFDISHQFEYYIYNTPFATSACSLFETKSGKCADETSFVVYLCRHLGIPAAYDFTPHWGNRSSSHSWSTLIGKDGKSIPYYMGNFPGDTTHYFHSYIKPKVFRYRFSINKQMVLDLKYESSLPSLFQNPHYTDVTNEYCETSDIERSVPEKSKDKRIAYICVFDNLNWVPVHYGRIHGGKVLFKSMGRGIVYMAGFYENNQIIPFGNPFILTEDGSVKEIQVNKEKMIEMTLTRKYPFFGAQDFFNSRMNGGMFQGSNNQKFFGSTILYTHKGITNGNWYSIPIKCNTAFKYLRYMGGRGSYCNINELEFYDRNNKKVEGIIIGTEGESWARKENVFDGNILTGFGGNSPDGNWVGLQLPKPTIISLIKYIGRNDGNGIEIGDLYELYYWNNNGYWELILSQQATDNTLFVSDIPSNGLYILKDITKGVEERIFTYENGKQIWW